MRSILFLPLIFFPVSQPFGSIRSPPLGPLFATLVRALHALTVDHLIGAKMALTCADIVAFFVVAHASVA